MSITATLRRAGPIGWVTAASAGLFLVAHLPFLASSLGDVDSVNFALGLRDFDPGLHRPHPPGYPIYIALGKLANLVLGEPEALAIWGVVFGALSAFALFQLFRSLDRMGAAGPGSGRRDLSATAILTSPAFGAMALTLASPLFWFTASRPMSDVTGLAAALAVQAVLATAMLRQARPLTALPRGAYDAGAAQASGRLILIGAFGAAIAIGTRSQALWLTVPLLLFVLADRAGRGAAGALIGSGVWFTIGALLWAVPLVLASGGLSAYLQAVSAQGSEDLAGVDLLATNLSLRRLATGLLDTFVHPWAWPALGVAVVVLAMAGAVVLLWRSRRALLVLTVAFLPYAAFHLLFHETVTTRYALPLIPAVSYLAVRGAFALGRAAGSLLTAAAITTSLVVVVPALAQYAEHPSPIAQALADTRAAAAREPGVVMGMHHAFARSAEALLGNAHFVLPAPPKHEWLELVKYWTGGGRGPVWFLADPKRTDLALIDPRARLVRKTYRWPFSSEAFLSGIRPDKVDWIEIRDPGWFAGEGWDLTPETAGVARLDRRTLDRGPIVAWVRRRDTPVTVMIGGRHLGRAGDPEARFSLAIDGRVMDAWIVPPTSPFFLRFVPLPAGSLSGTGGLARLEISLEAEPGRPRPPAAIEQFDLQDPDVPMVGFDQGWYRARVQPVDREPVEMGQRARHGAGERAGGHDARRLGRVAAAVLRHRAPRCDPGRRPGPLPRPAGGRLLLGDRRASRRPRTVGRRADDRDGPHVPARGSGARRRRAQPRAAHLPLQHHPGFRARQSRELPNGIGTTRVSPASTDRHADSTALTGPGGTVISPVACSIGASPNARCAVRTPSISGKSVAFV